MPFYQRSWNAVLGENGPKPRPYNIRVNATFEEELPGKEPEKPKVAKAKLEEVVEFRKKLNKQLNEYNTKFTKGAIEIEKNVGTFGQYHIEKDKVIFNGLYSEIHHCKNDQLQSKNGQKTELIAREFKATSLIKPDELYLILLRYIGNQNKFIVQTMDIFFDNKLHIFLFQEYASHGNGFDYITDKKAGISESLMIRWARDLYSAMSYLGDLGISHRSIQPKHILLFPGTGDQPNEFQIKLSGFRDAIIYWDPTLGDIIYQRCKPQNYMRIMFFQAPETFSDSNEYFDPVDADVWSFGSTLFYFVSRILPFNARFPLSQLDSEIRNNIARIDSISDPVKFWLFGLLRTNTQYRTDFDSIFDDPIFVSTPDSATSFGKSDSKLSNT